MRVQVNNTSSFKKTFKKINQYKKNKNSTDTKGWPKMLNKACKNKYK